MKMDSETGNGQAVQTALVLRTCNSELKSHGGFQWPSSGTVEAADYRNEKACGHGLHGLLWGEGNGVLLDWSEEAKWLVVEVEVNDELLDLGGKVKFRRGKVLHCGTRKDATDYIVSRLTKSASVVGAQVGAGNSGTATAGYSGTATAGYYGTATAGNSGTATAGYSGTATAGNSGTATAGNSGTATAGYYGTATAGNSGTATAGNSGTATAGYSGTATAGYYGTATAGYYGTATAGNSGTATAGNYGTATAGNSGTATAGNYGTATAGYYGTATAGYSGTATAGYYGVLQLSFWDGNRRRLVTLYVGEDGILPNVSYKLDAAGKPVAVESKLYVSA